MHPSQVIYDRFKALNEQDKEMVLLLALNDINNLPNASKVLSIFSDTLDNIEWQKEDEPEKEINDIRELDFDEPYFTDFDFIDDSDSQGIYWRY